tara:strand:+ start:303 stop:938 length:636 start_codon:yes stop_codon:yes gene_type:complete
MVDLPHLPSCKCVACKQKRKDDKAERKAEHIKRNDPTRSETDSGLQIQASQPTSHGRSEGANANTEPRRSSFRSASRFGPSQNSQHLSDLDGPPSGAAKRRYEETKASQESREQSQKSASFVNLTGNSSEDNDARPRKKARAIPGSRRSPSNDDTARDTDVTGASAGKSKKNQEDRLAVYNLTSRQLDHFKNKLVPGKLLCSQTVSTLNNL